MKKVFLLQMLLLLFTTSLSLNAQEKGKEVSTKPKTDIRPVDEDKKSGDPKSVIRNTEQQQQSKITQTRTSQDPDQSIKNEHIFSKEELKELWEHFSKDKEMVMLLREVERKGFKRVQSDDAQWGLKADLIEGRTQKEGLLCVYDYYNERTKEKCTVLWGKQGNELYKAYFILDNSQKDFHDALEHAQEWFVADGKIQKANSWHSCVTRNLKTRCASFCASSFKNCSALLLLPNIGTAVYLGCVGGICGGCASLVILFCK